MTDSEPKFKVGDLVRYVNRNMDKMCGIRKVQKVTRATINTKIVWEYVIGDPETGGSGGVFLEHGLCHANSTMTTPTGSKIETFKMGDKVRVKGCAQTFTITTICYGGEGVSPYNGVYLELCTKEQQLAEIDKKLADVMATVAELMEQKKKLTSSE